MKLVIFSTPWDSTPERMIPEHLIDRPIKEHQASLGRIAQSQTEAQVMPAHRIAKEQLTAVNTLIRLL